MSEPLVCAIMLTKDRPEMARKAVECFRSQRYANKQLLIYDTSNDDIEWPEDWDEDGTVAIMESNARDHHGNLKTIGYLRNRANVACGDVDIFVHFDDDDYSHPERIAEQVALLVASGAECVGYREMLFWEQDAARAWIYSNPTQRNYCLGTSLCYWRRAWEKSNFADTSSGDEGTPMFGFQSKLDRLAFSSLFRNDCIEVGADKAIYSQGAEPRMIARLHGGNTASKIHPESTYWRRVPEWDAYCERVMKI